MKARKNPTLKQLFGRLRRQPPYTLRDPRYENDPYWVLRLQGHPASHAKRVFRDELPRVKELTIQAPDDGNTEDILFEVGSVIREVEVSVRPPLTEEVIPSLLPRRLEYTVWHENLTGFGVRVRTSGHKSYILLYRGPDTRKLRKLTIGSVQRVSYETALGVARQLRSEAREGSDLVKLLERLASREEKRRLRQLPPCYPTLLDGLNECETSACAANIDECREQAVYQAQSRQPREDDMKSDDSADMAIARSVVDWLCKN
jgi:hypothetical protein